MSAELQLKEYLENSTESSKRIRTIFTILVVVMVLIFAGLLNTWKDNAWNRERITFHHDYIRELDLKIAKLTQAKWQLASSANGTIDPDKYVPLVFEQVPPSYGLKTCAKTLENKSTRQQNEAEINEQLRCYRGAKQLSEEFLKDSIKAYVENVYLIRVPFFGVAFDINDLGAIGGLSLIVILIMLRLNLRNFIVSLRISFKAARNAKLYDDFYDVLASRQLFAFPPLKDPEQASYKGRTERIWRQSDVKTLYLLILKIFSLSFYLIKKASWTMLELFLVSTYEEDNRKGPPQAEDGWHSNPHPILALVPTWICLVPALVYAAVVVNDYRTSAIGSAVDDIRTIRSLWFSMVCFVVILGLGCWCVSKCIEIDELWKDFQPKTPRVSTATPLSSRSMPTEVTPSAEDNGSKSVTPAHTPA